MTLNMLGTTVNGLGYIDLKKTLTSNQPGAFGKGPDLYRSAMHLLLGLKRSCQQHVFAPPIYRAD